MTQHLITTRIRVATCNRCGAYVLASLVGGIRCAADPPPLASSAVPGLMAAGTTVYALQKRLGKPHKLDFLGLEHIGAWKQGRIDLLAAHGCGCSALDSTAFEEAPEDPQEAPVTPGRPGDGSHHPPAHARASQGPSSRSAARSANPRRFRCSKCRKLIPLGEAFAIEMPVWQENEFKFRKGRKRELRTIKGWGYETWAVHGGGCPDE